MGFRFYKRIKILPGVNINLSKSGTSVSLGRPGATLNVGRRGVRSTVGAPGTGVSYTSEKSWSQMGGRPAKQAPPSHAPRQPARGKGQAPPVVFGGKPEHDYFNHADVPPDEQALVDGWKLLLAVNYEKALEKFLVAAHLADGAFLSGMLLLRLGRFEESAQHLRHALDLAPDLGRRCAKYNLDVEVELELTEETTALLKPTPEGVLLALAEACQRLGRDADAAAALRSLVQSRPGDALARLALAELLVHAWPGEKAAMDEVLALTAGVGNENAQEAALMLYKARALAAQGLLEAARDLLGQTLRRTKNRPKELLLALRYERAMIYEKLGRADDARTDLELVYADDPRYEDVAKRLGIG